MIFCPECIPRNETILARKCRDSAKVKLTILTILTLKFIRTFSKKIGEKSKFIRKFSKKVKLTILTLKFIREFSKKIGENRKFSEIYLKNQKKLFFN